MIQSGAQCSPFKSCSVFYVESFPNRKTSEVRGPSCQIIWEPSQHFFLTQPGHPQVPIFASEATETSSWSRATKQRLNSPEKPCKKNVPPHFTSKMTFLGVYLDKLLAICLLH